MTDSITISGKPLPAVNIGDDTTLCIGSTLLLNATTASATYLWQNGTTGPTFTVSSAGTYSVIVTVNGCSVTDSVAVSYIGPPSITSLGSDTSICQDSTLLLDAYIQTAHYVWSNGDTLSYITVSQTGTYTVTVSDACGTATASENVTVAPCTCKIAIPTAFSPNNDGKNDYYYVLTQCPLQNFEFDIYNRWGQKIFMTDTVTGKWDGTYKGAKQPLGVYVYFLKYTDPYTNLDHSQTGNVTLMR
jgi:gliding motility-associated-like protein